MYLFKIELRFSRNPFSFCPGGLQKLINNHLRLRSLISRKIILKLQLFCFGDSSLHGMFSFT